MKHMLKAPSALLALCLLLAGVTAALAEEEIVSAPVDEPVGEATEDALWTEEIVGDAGEIEIGGGEDARPSEPASNAAEGLCTREKFAQWYDGALARAKGADHLAGPEGDVNSNNFTIVLPGETVAVVPICSLDRDGEYSIQGGIMAFSFYIYQFEDAVVETDISGRSMLPRTPLPDEAKLTPTSWETIPVPYGARIGLTDVEDGSVMDYSYTSGYVNNTGLPILLQKSKLGNYDGVGKMLGRGGSYGTYSFQGSGNVYHEPTLLFLENAYLITSDTSEFGKELIWQDDAPKFPIRMVVDDKAHTYELPNPIRKGYEFWGWTDQDSSWYWGYLGYPGQPTQTDVHGCYKSELKGAITTVTLDIMKATLMYEDYPLRGLRDCVMVPQFLSPSGERDCLTLGFNPRGGTVNGKKYYICETKDATRQFSVDVGTIVPVYAGHTFRGWCTDPKDPEGTLIRDTSPEASYYWRSQGHTELYAVWKDNTVKKVALSKCKVTGISDQTYTGRAIKPRPTVKYGTKTLTLNKDYTVTYKNNKDIGKATVILQGKGDYAGTVTRAFRINPKAVAVARLTAGKKSLTVQWKKAAGGAGYQLQYSLKQNFASKGTVTVANNARLKLAIGKLKSGKTYYVRIRAYKKIGSAVYCSPWSKVKSATVK